MVPIPLNSAQGRAFRASLLRWFATHRRDLPWRQTRDPYHIWISEIMLQQTRVAAVFEHYAQFLRRFPDLNSLATARLQDVLAAWSGLGYYRRARALHQAARIMMRDHNGRLPSSSEALQTLPGIGRYTAAAIASIAFGEPCAVVDGNVERVLRRFFRWRNEPLPRIWDAAQQLLSRRAPGNFNQAIMELGALVCLPASPHCQTCPIRRRCLTRGPIERTAAPPRKAATAAYALAIRKARVYLVRRGGHESLMPAMWELPQLFNGEGESTKPDFTLRHSITVTDHTVHVCCVVPSGLRGGRWFPLPDAATLPLTGLTRRILRRTDLI